MKASTAARWARARRARVRVRETRSALLAAGWEGLWNLDADASFLDIGSGYGKVVMHLRLAVGMRKAVGVECVGSRVQIANKALYTINVEDITRACKEKAGDGAAATQRAAGAPAGAAARRLPAPRAGGALGRLTHATRRALLRRAV